MAIQWDSKLSVSEPRYKELTRTKLSVTTFACSREEAIEEAVKFARQYGYDKATVDKIVRIG